MRSLGFDGVRLAWVIILILGIKEVFELAAHRHQLVKATALDHFTAFNIADLVCVQHSGEPVGDNDRGALVRDRLDRRLYACFGVAVERTGGLVQKQDRCVAQDGAGNCTSCAYIAAPRSIKIRATPAPTESS